MNKFLQRFIHEEDGAEMVEWAIVIAIAAVIAVPVLALVRVANSKVQDASKMISEINPGDYINDTGDGGGTGADGTGGTGGAGGAGGAGGGGGTEEATE